STQLLALQFAGQEDVQSVLSRLDRNLTHADRMIQDLLDASHIKSGKLISIRVIECDPCKIAREVIEELTAIHSSHFELKTINMRLLAVPVGLRRIIENLAAHVIKYSALVIPICISLNMREDRVDLKLENSGNPISAGDQRTIFD